MKRIVWLRGNVSGPPARRPSISARLSASRRSAGVIGAGASNPSSIPVGCMFFTAVGRVVAAVAAEGALEQFPVPVQLGANPGEE